MKKIAVAAMAAVAMILAPVAGASPNEEIPNPRPPHVRGHANPDLEHLCTQFWFTSHHGTGLCLYYNS